MYIEPAFKTLDLRKATKVDKNVYVQHVRKAEIYSDLVRNKRSVVRYICRRLLFPAIRSRY